MSNFPRVVLWAWERPEKLEFINPREVGVAFLATTLDLSGEDVRVRPRLQPLRVPRGTALMAVARIEADHSRPPKLTLDQRRTLALLIEDLARLPGISAIQVDFDATTSQRAFYRDLLFDLRRRLPDSTALSITALSSWCLYDNWLQGIPIDEAVPMLFRMGPERREVLRYLQSGKDFRPEVCRQSIGVSTDEPLVRLPSARRAYVFHPKAWSELDVRKAIHEVQAWP